MPRWKNTLQTSEEVYRLKRNAVLREATRIIARRGYHNTSLDDVADALQVAKGTLYNYVKDKQEILFECHKMTLDIGEHAAVFAEERGKTGYSRLRLILRTYLAWLHGTLDVPGIANEVTALRPADQKTVIARRDAFEAKLVGYFEQGFADGTIRKVDARIAVYTIMGAVNAIHGWYNAKGRLTIDQIATSMIDVMMHGLDTPKDAHYVDETIPTYSSVAGVIVPVQVPQTITTLKKRVAAKRNG